MNLQYYVGKICTIFTTPINRNYKEENPGTYPKQLLVYFMGVVEEVDHEGVTITNCVTGMKASFFRSQIVGIAEEEVLDPENEEDAKIIQEMKKTKEVALAPQPPVKIENISKNNGPFVDPLDMANLAKLAGEIKP